MESEAIIYISSELIVLVGSNLENMNRIKLNTR